MYVSCQVLSILYNYWFVHRIPVSFSGAGTYNKFSRIMMLCCCTHSSLIQCNHTYRIPEYEALYDLKRQWYYEFVPFLSNQPGIDIQILGGDVVRHYLHQTFGLQKHAFDRGFWSQYHINCYCIGTESKIVWKWIIWELVPEFLTLDFKYIGIFNKCKSLNNGSLCALYLLFVMIRTALFRNLASLPHSNPQHVIPNWIWDKIN